MTHAPVTPEERAELRKNFKQRLEHIGTARAAIVATGQSGGEIECRCGGDLCVCTNYGTRVCPVCYGEAVVTQARYDQWWERQREISAAFRAAMSESK